MVKRKTISVDLSGGGFGNFGGFGQFSGLLLVFWMALISEALCTVFFHTLCVS